MHSEGNHVRSREHGRALPWLRILPLVLALAVVCASGSKAFAQPRFGLDRRVNDDPPGSASHSSESSGQHNLVAVGDTVYFVWSDAREGGGGVYFARSVDRGMSFGLNSGISDTERAGLPAIAVRGNGEIDVAWQDHRDHEINGRIYFDQSKDGGRTFGVDHSIVSTFPPGTKQMDPAIAVDPETGNIYVAWFDTRYPPIGAIVCARSRDGGASFDPPVRLSYGNPPRKPTLGLGPEGEVYLGWYEHLGGDEVRLAVSHDLGQSFGPSVKASLGLFPSLAVAPSGDIFIASIWSCPPDHSVWVVRSSDGGQTFGPPTGVAQTTVTMPSLATGRSGQVFVVWSREGPPWEVRFAQSTDRGVTFSAGELVNDVSAPLLYTSVTALPTGRPLVAWTDHRWDFWNPDLYVDGGSILATRPRVSFAQQDHAAATGALMMLGPNPFRSNVAFRVVLPPALPGQCARLELYDTAGRIVRHLREFAAGEAGEHEIQWDGTDGQGRPVPCGVYFVSLTSEGQRWTERVLRLK